ncbi:uncharacterized protein K02A2.6-like [Sabethes cyaneus]|uniref:uncharacterized protein K02A2.6-like n=1 Tax=Sabethes cyaneus TaxID=53552 RepID=UPI00237E6938|nr:uncharacterized protein K02A2.6-like [Sabethes cyaneus]
MTEVFLTDAIITGCSSTELRRRILQQDRPLGEIEALGITLEGIEHQVKDFSHKASDQSTDNRILKISSKPLGKPDDRSAYMPPKSFTKKPYKSQNADFSCYNCGRRNHIASAEVCPAKGKICHLCKRVGHFQSRCRFRKLQDKSTIHSKKIRLVEEEKNDTQILEDNGKTYYAFHTGNDSNIVKCEIGGVALDVLIDSGSDVNLVTDAAWQHLKQKNVKIHQSAKGSSRILRGYASNIPLTILRTFITDVQISGKSIRAEFYVIKGGQRCLLGDQTSKSLGILKVGLDIHLIGTDTKPFSKIKDVQVHIQMDSGVKPIFQPLRRVPMPLEDAVNKKLELMLSRDIIERKEGPATWVSPLVVVGKSDGDPRICLDLHRVNEAVLRERHPMPIVDDYLARLGEGKYWTKLDIKEAFLQIELAPESRDVTTFITNKGLFRFKRLPFGLVTAPELFQKVMDQVLAGCSGTMWYLDDVIIEGNDLQQHDARLNEVV